jgi:hemoglobin-like flavoprotein
MEPREVSLVQASFETAAGLGEQVAEIFYGELFEIDPSLRRLFTGDMKDQGRKLLTTLALVVRSLHDLDSIIVQVRRLAVKHLDYGVAPEHYTHVGNALLRTLQKGLGRDFTPEVREAWRQAYITLAITMKEAAYGASAELRKGAA